MTATHGEVMTKLAAFLAECDDRPLASHLIDTQDELRELKIRVGALPVSDRDYLSGPIERLTVALAALDSKLEVVSHAG